MTYAEEIVRHRRVLAAAMFGMGFGLLLNNYVAGLFGPRLIAEFGWSKADYALVSVVPIVMMVIVPFVGRLADLFGVRRVAVVGVLGIPASFFALSLMRGGLVEFLVLTGALMTFGTLTSSTIYTRLVAERFDRARGIAFAIVLTGPPLIGAIAAPLLADLIAAEGWRAGYRALAVVTLAGGLGAVALIPAGPLPTLRAARRPGTFIADFRAIAGRRVFWLIVAGMFLCNLPQSLGSSQLKLMALDSGATAQVAVVMLSSYALGVIAGRIACGLALDRFDTRMVAFATLSLPAVGFAMLWSPFDAGWLMIAAMALVGMAQGAEGDIGAFLVTRHFDLANYSFVLGLVSAALSAASSIGAMTLSIMLRGEGDFGGFVFLSAIVTAVGAGLFLLIDRHPPLAEARS